MARGSFCKEWGHFAKKIPAPKTQRWGRNAKRGRNAKVGSKRKGKLNTGVKTQKKMPYSSLPTWSRERFELVATDRGYVTPRSITRLVAESLEYSERTAAEMLTTGRFKWEHILILGSRLEMTPREFCDVFLNGLFKENNVGHFVCSVDDKKIILKKPKVRVRTILGDYDDFLEDEDESEEE